MPTKNRLSLALLAAGCCLAATPLLAAPVLLSQSFQLSNSLNSNSLSLNFNLGSFLAGQGYSSQDIVSGSAALHGYSDIQYGGASYQPYGEYLQTGQTSHTGYGQSYDDPSDRSLSCRWYGDCRMITPTYSITDKVLTHSRDIWHGDVVADAMRLLIGSSSAADTADTRYSAVGDYGGSRYEGQTCASVDNNRNCSYNHLYARERNTYGAIYGALDTTLSFDAAALLDVRSDGILGVGVKADYGQFRLSSISFNVMVERAAAAVPEPASLALAASALAALALTRRRRKLM